MVPNRLWYSSGDLWGIQVSLVIGEVCLVELIVTWLCCIITNISMFTRSIHFVVLIVVEVVVVVMVVEVVIVVVLVVLVVSIIIYCFTAILYNTW